jgi:hypothetical protein
MKKLMFLALLAAAGCGSGVTATTGLAACNTAAACNMLPGANIGGVSVCTQVIQSVNQPGVANAIHLSPDQVNCLAESGSDCDRARRCLNNGDAPTECSGSSQMCDGNTWISCDGVNGINGNNGTRRFDCKTLDQNATCYIANGRADCGYATCSLSLPSCEGDVVVSCDLGIRHRIDCSLSDSTCIPTGFAAHCRGKGAACSGGALRCEGDTLVTCVDGQEARDNCAKRNLGCFQNANAVNNTPACALGDQCNPATYGAECSNLTLKVCNQGRPATIDCAAYGFNGCTVNGGGRCTKS